MDEVKVGYVQWPEGLTHSGAEWDRIRRNVEASRVDLLITNEMPFGSWLPERSEFDSSAAHSWAEAHEQAIDALKAFQVKAVVSSRPVIRGGKLVNEAFGLQDGQYRYLHHKKFFPQEAGFYEETWFDRGQSGFETFELAGLEIGVLLCTELFFNEHAREYGRGGVDLIVCPRASGTSMHRWKAAGALAAIVSGAYLISSNRYGPGELGQQFGGMGFAYAPDGMLIGETSKEAPVCVANVSVALARQQKTEYPCYVRDL